MCSALERIVEDEDIAGVDLAVKPREYVFHRRWQRAIVERERESLSHELPTGVANPGGEIPCVTRDRGIRRVRDRERHLVHKRTQGVADKLEFDRVVVAHSSSISISPSSRRTRASGGTTVVESYSA